MWRQSGTLSGEEPAYSKSQSVAKAQREAEREAETPARLALPRDARSLGGPPVRHPGVKCDISGMLPITGNRWLLRNKIISPGASQHDKRFMNDELFNKPRRLIDQS